MRKKHYYGVDFDKKREELLKSEVAKSFIEDVIAKADAAIGSSYEALKMSEYMEFYKSGSRPLFERKYFEGIKLLCMQRAEMLSGTQRSFYFTVFQKSFSFR